MIDILEKPLFCMLIGLPASGKSTWIQKNVYTDAMILSTDKYIEEYALALGKTYNEVFTSFIKNAESILYSDLKYAISQNLNIYWDQTNLTQKSRGKKLEKIPSHYFKIAFVFDKPDDVLWKLRLNNRPGKNIPENVLTSMMKTFEYPELSEGFDAIMKPKDLQSWI